MPFVRDAQLRNHPWRFLAVFFAACVIGNVLGWVIARALGL